MPKKALARGIRFSDARSYRRLVPNAMGVTAIAAVNGRGAYAKRYGRARRMLQNKSASFFPTWTVEAPKKKASKKSRGKKRVTWGKHAAAAKARRAHPKTTWGAHAKAAKRKRAYAASARAAGTALAARKAKAARKPTSKKSARAKAASVKRAASLRVKRLSKSRKFMAKGPRLYAGKYKAARVRLSPTQARQSYVRSTRSGGLAHVPVYALLGFKSRAAMTKAQKDPARGERIAKRLDAIRRRRERAAEAIRKHGGILVPNRRSRRRARVLTFSENQGMKRSKKSRKRAKGRKHVAHRRTTKRVRKHTRRAAPKRRTRKSKRIHRTPVRRHKARKHVVKRVTHRRRRHVRNEPMMVANKKRAKRKSRKGRKSTVGKFRKGGLKITRRFKHPRRVKRATLKLFSSNRKHHRRARHVPHSFHRRNVNLGGTFQKQLIEGLKIGAVAFAGFAAHRVLSNLLKKNITQLDTSDWGGVISGGAMVLIGIPASVKFFPGDAKLASAGMIVSFLMQLGTTLVSKFLPDQAAQVLPYLSGYGDRAGSARSLGSYYEYQPGGVAGLGEYYQPGCATGGGMMQAAAGLGRLRQAAAGMGRISEAAAGFGALRQAAAGVGEYIGTNLEGVGDYVEVEPEYTRPIPTDDGIRPNLSEAEKALNVAEGAAGVAGADRDVSAQYTIDPMDCSMPTGSDPEGERAGTLAGRDGIFGPLQD